MQNLYITECAECGFYTESESILELQHSYECPKCKNLSIFIHEHSPPSQIIWQGSEGLILAETGW